MNPTVETIFDHLSKCPFAPILHLSTEKTDLIALKVMCVIDYYMEQKNFYRNIQSFFIQFLLNNLLNFHKPSELNYYNYRPNERICEKLLRCKMCTLIGPYKYILIHM